MAVPGRERTAPKLLYPYGRTESLNLSCSDRRSVSSVSGYVASLAPPDDNITGVALKNVPAVRVKASAR
jgi:hypothetical protein